MRSSNVTPSLAGRDLHPIFHERARFAPPSAPHRSPAESMLGSFCQALDFLLQIETGDDLPAASMSHAGSPSPRRCFSTVVKPSAIILTSKRARILRQRRRAFDCWPLKSCGSQPVKSNGNGTRLAQQRLRESESTIGGYHPEPFEI
jgi:hypothetical protein